jgi:hypothetical protein
MVVHTMGSTRCIYLLSLYQSHLNFGVVDQGFDLGCYSVNKIPSFCYYFRVGGVIPQNNTFIRYWASFWAFIFITTITIPVNRIITPDPKIPKLFYKKYFL